MKKKLLYIVLLILTLASTTVVLLKTLELSKYKRILRIGSKLPDINVLKQDHTVYNMDLLNNTKTALLFYSTTCSHCKKQFDKISLNISYLDNTKFVFISSEAWESIDKFANQYPKIREKGLFLQDSEKEQLKKFGSTSIPHLFFYIDKTLRKQIRGEFDLTEIDKTWIGTD